MYNAQHLKRALIIMRRASWPERDKVNDMIRTDSPLITPEVKTFLRDAYDHCIQIMDLIESYKEITSSIIDLYLSMVSNRMNEIMKVLTIISVIFIPLTFIAGIYGMNFSHTAADGKPPFPITCLNYTGTTVMFTRWCCAIYCRSAVVCILEKGMVNRL
jgi:magnesium/cobalt transport protein CorA